MNAGLRYTVHSKCDITDKRFVGDPTRILQVLLNLLSNAVKFTQQGYVDFTVNCLPEEDGMALIQFGVRDTGIGMTEDQL